MDAIETLMNEHRLIERACDALVAFADEARRKEADDKAELSRFVSFIRGFADACHHGKEENILFKAMVAAGFPRHGGPVAVMLMEHDMGRQHVTALGELAEKKAPWTAEDRQQLADAAYRYANLLRQHIHKEDAILYPMAEQRLPPEVMEQVSADCERFEAERTGSGEHERLHQLGEELVSRHAGALHPGGDDPHGHSLA
jgi:hemerythrin-like domain-containing protein